MKTKKVTRYYCDFCRKSGQNSTNIRDHEARCFGNPKRTCSCGRVGMDALREAWLKDGEEGATQAAKACPMCVVAIAQQIGYDRDDLQELWNDLKKKQEERKKIEDERILEEYRISGLPF